MPRRKKTTEEFVINAKEIHGEKYNYSSVDYYGALTKVKIICLKHGIFEQKPNDHLNNHGCPTCAYENKKLTTNKFIQYAINVHGKTYNYSLVECKNRNTKVKIICDNHGVFEQNRGAHLNGSGCQKCVNENQSSTRESFIKKAKDIHGKNKYDYSLVKYKNSYTKVKIICKKHGIFLQVPSSHLRRIGCPKCQESSGERKIRIWLENTNINYVQEKRFKNCRYKNPLPFDFYLPEYSICIEYDGEQHYKFAKNFGKKILTQDDAIWNLYCRKRNDRIKTKYCLLNDITLLRIPYYEKNNIDSILESKLSS